MQVAWLPDSVEKSLRLDTALADDGALDEDEQPHPLEPRATHTSPSSGDANADATTGRALPRDSKERHG